MFSKSTLIRFLLITTVNLIAFKAQSQEHKLRWAHHFGGSGYENVTGLCVDKDGYSYQVGVFNGTVDFDPGTGTYNLTASGRDIYVLKLNPKGKFVWAGSIKGGNSTEQAFAITLDGANNLYIAGIYQGTIDLDIGSGVNNVKSNGQYDIFFAKMDSSGSFIWGKSVGGSKQDLGYRSTVDPDGNIYITGRFNGTCDFDPSTNTHSISAAKHTDAFAVKYDSSGNFEWVSQFRGDDCQAYALDYSPNGELYVGGRFQGQVDFDPGTGTHNLNVNGNGYDPYLVKLDSKGRLIWVRQFVLNGDYNSGANDLDVDPNGNPVMTGVYRGTIDLDPDTGKYILQSVTNEYNPLTWKLDSTGVFKWGYHIDGTSQDNSWGILTDGAGSVYTAGYFGNTVDFDPGSDTFSVKAQGGRDWYIMKVNATGQFKWVKTFGGSKENYGNRVVPDGIGNIYAVGRFEGTCDFNPTSSTYNLTSNGNYDGAIVKLSIGFDDFTLGPDTVLCADSFLINTEMPQYPHRWENDSTYEKFWVKKTGDYWVEIYTPLDTLRDTIHVTLLPNPKYKLPNDTTFCSKDSLELNTGLSDVQYQHLWNTSVLDTFSNIIVDTSGQYIVEVENSFGCIISDTIQVKVNPTPYFNLGNDTSFCSIDSLILSVEDKLNFKYNWNNLDTTHSIVIKKSGKYNLELVSDLGCFWKDSINVTVHNTPYFNLRKDTAICSKDSILLSTGYDQNVYDHLWNTLATSSEIYVDQTKEYSVEVISPDKCTYSDTFDLSVNPTPFFELGKDTTFCSKDSLILEVSKNADYTYLWNTNANDTSIIVKNSGKYHLEIETDKGCVWEDSINVIVNPTPYFELGNDTSICQGDSIILKTGYDLTNTHLWNNNTTHNQRKIQENGLFKVSVTTPENCSFTDSIQVGYLTMPQYDLGNDTAICLGDTLEVATGLDPFFYTFKWNVGSSKSSVKVSQSDTLEVRVTNIFKCNKYDTIIVSIDSLPEFNLPNDTMICDNDSIQIQSNINPGFHSFSWEHGPGLHEVWVSSSGNYVLNVTDTNACSFKDTFTLSTKVLPSFDLGPDSAYCKGDTIELNTGYNALYYSFYWNTTDTTPSLKVASMGDYNVRVTDTLGCLYTDTVSISLDTIPVFNLGPDLEYCSGDSVWVNSGYITTNYTYQWSHNVTTPSVYIKNPGSYHLTVTSPAFCTFKDTVVITENPNPIFSFGPDLKGCEGDTFTLVSGLPNTGYTHQWSTSESTNNIKVFNSGDYDLQVTTPKNCIWRDTINVEINELPTFTLPDEIEACDGETVTLDVNSSFAGPLTYAWSSGEDTKTITKSISGVYHVTAETNNNCTYSDTTEIIIHPNPTVDLGADTAICGVFAIDKGVVNNPNDTYLWNNLETVSMRSINNYGLHILAVENEFGCRTIDSILIEELQLPFISLPSKIVLTCKEETFLVQVAEEEVDYLWNTGEQSNEIIVKDTGLYTLTYSLSNCSITDSILVSRVCPTDYPLLIPTAFTPNAGGKDGDNLNNTFRPHIPVSNGPLKKYNMQVFNRWGEMLFETDDPTKGWDGKVRGKTCPNGVYMYLFTYQFEFFIEETQSGTLHLIR